MTARQFALQVAAIGTGEVWHAAWPVLAVAAVLLLAAVAVAWLRRPAPLIADAPEGHGCDWCDDRLPAGRCDCTGDCGRWCCMAGSAVTAREDAALKREISEMVRRYGRG